jgi:hypothetical protein
MGNFFWETLTSLLGAKVGETLEKAVSWNYQNDPSYKKNLQRLIERNRQFEEAKQ